ncbi:dynamin-like protein LeoC, partial [Escherichia coli]
IANESQSRLQILQQQTHAKVRFTLLATACGCFIAGAGGMAALLSQIW